MQMSRFQYSMSIILHNGIANGSPRGYLHTKIEGVDTPHCGNHLLHPSHEHVPLFPLPSGSAHSHI